MDAAYVVKDAQKRCLFAAAASARLHDILLRMGHFCTVHLGMSATNVDDVCVLYLPRFSSFLPQPIRVHVHQEVICLDQFLALRLSQFCEEVE